MSVSTKYKDQTIAQLSESGTVTLETAGKYCEDNITVEYAATESGGFSGSYNDLTDKPTIPDAVTEDTVSGWGFTKNTGTYSKPAAGIPKSDLDSAVQASLGKADSALQSHQSLAAYRTASAQDVIDATKQDKLIAGENITIDNGVISASGSSTGGGGVIEVALTPGTGHYVADKTYNEIYARYAAGTSVVKMSFIDSFGGEPEIQYAVITAASKYGLWLTENGERTWTAHSGLYQYTGTTWTYSATVDSALSDSSAKPVENRAVTAELKKKLEVLPMASSSTYGVVKPTAKTSEMTREVGVDKEGALWTASGSYNDLTDKPTIPDAVTEDTVSGWGFTKNTGTYSKPTGGIPKTDLASAVQTSLGKADSALQTVPSTYRTASAQDSIDSGKVDKVTGKGLSTNDYTAAAKAKVDAIPASPKYTDTVYDDTAVKSRLAAVEGKLNGSGSASFASIETAALKATGEVEVFGAQPHMDFHYGNSTGDYTSRIIETESGKINIAAPNGVAVNDTPLTAESVTLTANTDRITNVSYTAKYLPLIGAVFVRIYGKINVEFNTGYDYDLFSIGSRLPNSTAALSVKCGKNAMANAKKTVSGIGAIQIRPLEPGINGYDVYITGFWFV